MSRLLGDPSSSKTPLTPGLPLSELDSSFISKDNASRIVSTPDAARRYPIWLTKEEANYLKLFVESGSALDTSITHKLNSALQFKVI